MRLFAAAPRLAVALALSATMSGCTKSTTVIFANATSHSVSISYKDDNHKIAVEIIAPNATVEIKHLLDDRFSIRTSKSTMNYERNVVPGSYIDQIGFGPFFKRIVKAQLEQDGCIYLLSKDEKIPNQRHKAQPPDFPVCPRMVTANPNAVN